MRDSAYYVDMRTTHSETEMQTVIAMNREGKIERWEFELEKTAKSYINIASQMGYPFAVITKETK